MEKKLLILIFIGLSFVAIAVGLVVSKEMTIRSGTTILLETMPVDPRDLLRGDYVVLHYRISNIDTSTLPGERSFSLGQTVYVGLEKGGNFWRAVLTSSKKPEQGIFIRGRVRNFWGSKANIDYGLESYFMPEGEGLSIEKMMRGGNNSVAVEAVVDGEGQAMIKRLVTMPGQARPISPIRPDRGRIIIPQPINPPVVRAPGLCGNGVCDAGENYAGCTRDCAEVIYPFASDVESCGDSTGKVWPAVGPGAATWFVWNRCSRQKSYRVNRGEEIILHAYTDSCPSCVCNYPEFCIEELTAGAQSESQCFNFGNKPGSSTFHPYTAVGDQIRITADKCFYLEVLRKK